MTVSRRNAVTRSELPASSQLPRARRDSLTRVAMRPVQRTDGVAAGGHRPVEGERKMNGRPCAGRSPAPCYPTQLHPTLTAPRRPVPQAKGASAVTGDDDDGHTHPASGVPGASQAHHQARRNGDTFPRDDASLRSVSHRRLGGLADKSRTSPSPAMLGEDTCRWSTCRNSPARRHGQYLQLAKGRSAPVSTSIQLVRTCSSSWGSRM